jgi:hypothetical protein
MSLASRIAIAIFCSLTVVIGLFAQIQALTKPYWNVELTNQFRDTIYVNVSLEADNSCLEMPCPPYEYSELVITPCPFGVPCKNGSYTLVRSRDIFSAVKPLKLSIREKYELSGRFYYAELHHCTGQLCGCEACVLAEDVAPTTFPDDYYGGEVGYMGLYRDAGRDSSCVIAQGEMTPFEMWIWCGPSVRGLHCAEFRILYPSNVIPGVVTQNHDIIESSTGTLEEGIGVCYSECQYDWHWNYHQAMVLTDGSVSALFAAPPPGLGSIEFISCVGGNAEDRVYIATNLMLNDCEQTAVKPSSWGSIKSLFGK